MKNNKLHMLFLVLMVMVTVALVSCSDWTEPETVDQTIKTPDQQDPVAFAAYAAKVRAYKQSEHPLVYAGFDNTPEKPTSGKDAIRPLPDSVDMIALHNADNLTALDEKDMKYHQENFATKFLYYVDLTKAVAAAGYTDACIARAAQYGFDGFVLGADSGDVAALLAKLSAVAGPGKGKLLLFAGNPAVVADNLAAFDYIALTTSNLKTIAELESQLDYATDFLGVTPAKLLVGSQPKSQLTNTSQTDQPAIATTAYAILERGLGGLAIFGIGNDYYYAGGNYLETGEAIHLLNLPK